MALNVKQRQINMAKKNKMFPQKCKVCGKTFYAEYPKHPQYCSEECRNAKIIKNEHVGEKFGKLTIVSDFQKNGRRYAECKCDCGGTKITLYKSLRNGGTTSCGCVRRIDVSNRINNYGVKLIRRTHKTEKGMWKCLCECPKCRKEFEIQLNKFNRTKSCGCIVSEKSSENMKSGWENTTSQGIEDNTQVFSMISKTKSKNNTSGTRGVSFNKRSGKWTAYIGFQRKLIYLGRYSKMEDAIAARKDAEEKIYGGFIEEFKKEHPERWKIIESSHEKAQKRKRKSMENNEDDD